MPYYSGIGSRRTPPPILEFMIHLAEWMSNTHWILRSGHAPGADQAFEEGAGHASQIFLPWGSFERDVPVLGEVYEPIAEAFEIAERFHPRWRALTQGIQKLMARNAHQVLGPDLDNPSAFLICWTPDGSIDGRGPDTGGTGQAIRIAHAHEVPIINLARPDHMTKTKHDLDELKRWLDTA